MILEILPERLFFKNTVSCLLRNENTAILHKVLDHDLRDIEIYLSTVAFLYIKRGRQRLINADGQVTEVESGQIVFLARDIYQVSDFVAEGGVFEAILIFVGEPAARELAVLPTHQPDLLQTVSVVSAGQSIHTYMQALLDVYSDITATKELTIIKVREFLLLLSAQDNTEIMLSSAQHFFAVNKQRDIREFMIQNCARNLTVTDYALLTGRSVSTFSRDFRRLFGTTPNQWLIEQRLAKAHDLLITTKDSVTAVATAVGYDNVSHFIAAYKARFGQTPNTTKTQYLTEL